MDDEDELMHEESVSMPKLPIPFHFGKQSLRQMILSDWRQFQIENSSKAQQELAYLDLNPDWLQHIETEIQQETEQEGVAMQEIPSELQELLEFEEAMVNASLELI